MVPDSPGISEIVAFENEPFDLLYEGESSDDAGRFHQAEKVETLRLSFRRHALPEGVANLPMVGHTNPPGTAGAVGAFAGITIPFLIA